ncbi:hypothetical protein [Embleya sp. AB8]|uniref:hypothetical protein n=1 Tax=Embleya sp. AB8 TaxID=3156304 RepID=UPI003C78A848
MVSIRAAARPALGVILASTLSLGLLGASQSTASAADPRASAPASAAQTAASAQQITRSEVLNRAQTWLNKGLVYGTGNYQGYRKDCSGYVSMAWGLSTPGPTTDDFARVGAVSAISKSQLLPGDALNNPGSGPSGHVVLFAGWANTAQTSYYGYEFTASRNVIYREIPYPYFSGYGSFDPVRRVNIVDDSGSTPPAPAAEWKTQTLVTAGGNLYHATRFVDGGWSGFGDVQSVAGSVPGGIRSSAEAGINGDTQIVAVGNNGALYHGRRLANGTWAPFADIGPVAGRPGAFSQVSVASVGSDLFVTGVADGRVFNSVRYGDGTWSGFADVSAQMTAPIGTVTRIATANVNGQLQVLAVSGGKVYHATRNTAGVWAGWNDTSVALRDVGAISDIAVAGTGGDLQIVATANNGATQYHGVRYANGTWQDWADLGSVLGPVTATNISAANVAGELQVGLVATDNRILHTTRHINGTWDGAGAINLSGVTGDHTGINLTGTLS